MLYEFVAERVGFEPTVRFCRTHAFQACALSHSAISPVKPVFAGARGFFQGKDAGSRRAGDAPGIADGRDSYVRSTDYAAASATQLGTELAAAPPSSRPSPPKGEKE